MIEFIRIPPPSPPTPKPTLPRHLKKHETNYGLANGKSQLAHDDTSNTRPVTGNAHLRRHRRETQHEDHTAAPRSGDGGKAELHFKSSVSPQCK